MSKALTFRYLDPFTLAIVTAVLVASVLPLSGQAAVAGSVAVKLIIALLFFTYGARLPRELVVENLANWRLHAMITFCTFVLFPLLALGSVVLVPSVLARDLYTGIVFLSVLPSTLQASVVFTSIARGNVAGAICSASLSNLLGVFLTPLLVALLLGKHAAPINIASIEAIVVQLLLPFVAGQLARPWLAGWADRNKASLTLMDRGSVVAMVYVAFSAAFLGGLRDQLALGDLAIVIVVDAILLGLVLILTRQLARQLGFSREDEIATVFCGSKKSLIVGLPMANVLFAGHAVGIIVIPLMVFHQLQLIACAILARRYLEMGDRDRPSLDGSTGSGIR